MPSTVTSRFPLLTNVSVLRTMLHFVLLLLCLPAVLAYHPPPGEEGNEEDRNEDTDDGEVEEEQSDYNEDKEYLLISRAHCMRTSGAGRAPEHGQLVCIYMRACIRALCAGIPT